MTRYDPFAYGEVRLDPNQQNGGSPPDAEDLLFAAGESVKQAPPANSSWALMNENVDDLLPGASPNMRETADFSAEILGEAGAFEDADSLYAESPFGEDASDLQPLEEMMADPSRGAAEQTGDDDGADLDDFAGYVSGSAANVADEEPVVAPVQEVAAQPREGDLAAPPTKRREVRRQRLPVAPLAPVAASPVAKRSSKKVKSGKQAGVPSRRRSSAFAAIMPLALCAGGGTAASWFLVMQSNPVMAGIIGAATLVGALFSWLFLRG
jgi:hypothetical protein